MRPRSLARLVGVAAPQVGDEFAVLHDRKARADFAMVSKVCLKSLPHPRESR